MEDEDDIGADIAAAFAEHQGNVPEPVEPQPTAAPEPVEAKEPAEAGRARDETGKFAKAPETAQSDPDTSAVPETTETASSDIRPPASWKAEAKAIFNDLPPLAREEIARRELDMQRGAELLKVRLAHYAPLDEILAPRQEKLSLNGHTNATYIRALVAADDMLSNPATAAQAMAQLAQMYGIPYGQGQAPAPQSQDPGLQTVFQQIQTLEQRLQAKEQAEQEVANHTCRTQIDAFQADPKNLYFEDVKPQMAVLLKSGEAQDLQDAYDKACWMQPNIRALVLADQKKAEQAAATTEARAKVEAAKRASGSVVGSSGLGASAKPPVNQNTSIEDDVRLAMQSIGGRA